jgi:tripartite-type tricarboxylate transporter receptor subunit TctC
MLPHINAGKLKALAVTSDERWPELPDVPTLRESKFDGIPALLWSGLLAPAGTPKAVIDKLNAAMIEGMKTPAVQATLAKLGLKTRALTPQQFDAVLADEARTWEAAVKESKIKLE